jgi:hypothetical protein
MNKQRGMFIFAVASLLMTAAYFQGCGVKADPAPPEVIRLKSVADLEVKLAGNMMLLRWSIPGEPSQMTRFRIFRSELETDGTDCPDCPRKHTLLVELSAEDARLQKEDGGKLIYGDATIRPGHLYSYSIAGCNRSGMCSEESNRAEADYLKIPVNE